LHAFTGGDGLYPASALVQGSDGNLYGTTTWGGYGYCNNGCGTIFQITPGGTFTTLYRFVGPPDDTAYPGGLIQATDGNFYGMTFGVVFRMSPDGTLTRVHTFSGGDDGFGSSLPLIQATDGSFYGIGGVAGGSTIFQMTPDGTVSILYTSTGGVDGTEPLAPLLQGTDGKFYGTASGGAFLTGVVFRLSP